MQDLTMLLEKEEYDGTNNEEGSKSDYSEGHISQLRFLSGKKRKNNFEEVVNVSTELLIPLQQNYEARVGFKCRSMLVKLREVYLILIEISHLKQILKATNLMSAFDCKIGKGNNQVILAMIECWWPTTHTFHLPYRELGITPRDFTLLIRIGIGTGEPMEFDESYTNYGNVYFGGILFGNSKSWARLELLGPIAVLENKAYTIDFGSAILGYLYYCLDQASKQEVKYIGGLFQLIEYHYYEYCQISHHILIDNRLDDFWPRMSAWQTKRQKFMGNKVKHHLVLMRQQLDLRTINNMQWDPFRNMKDALKQEVIIAGNISRKRVLLQCPFGRYEWEFVVDWEDDEGEAGTSQAGTSRGRGSRGRGSRGKASEVFDVFIDSSSEEEEEEDIEQSSTDYNDDDVIDEIKL
ncbi:hypothetical protein GIB67_021492 [Kingdonia uniflora]|uniref:Aminotransferase-like plant mobile domain-containing protein n=1 Tax=Kingdonia uniflora TaxID=39325 RepID=A0A7J7L9M8_9MAGN|nr:hypothetical protein GIB67_021492 [Kingdonia uniflora]